MLPCTEETVSKQNDRSTSTTLSGTVCVWGSGGSSKCPGSVWIKGLRIKCLGSVLELSEVQAPGILAWNQLHCQNFKVMRPILRKTPTVISISVFGNDQ